MNDDNKIFSVVIPVYNGEKTLGRTLASLISSKDYIHEVIIVDDHSEDNTLLMSDDFKQFFPIYLFSSDGYHNPGMARKTGLLQATGEWITFVDADDCLTPSSLRYVKKQINERSYMNLVLLHTQTIYYESGTFAPKNIGHSDNSCGGNFYKRQYLIDSGLFPHDTLKKSEDEYWNTIITKYIELLDGTDAKIDRYDYPVYEVHHDFDDGLSYALENWTEYAIKYHLLSNQYIVKYFIPLMDTYDTLKEDLEFTYINNFVFVYYLFQALIQEETDTIDIEQEKNYFRKALKFYIETFDGSKESMYIYYIKHEDAIHTMYAGARDSIGHDFEMVETFFDFLHELYI